MGVHSHLSTCNLYVASNPYCGPRKVPESNITVFLALSSGHWDLTSVHPLVTDFLGVKADLIQFRMRTFRQLFSLLFCRRSFLFLAVRSWKSVQSALVIISTWCTSGPIGSYSWIAFPGDAHE